jgi:hypothetical protein
MLLLYSVAKRYQTCYITFQTYKMFYNVSWNVCRRSNFIKHDQTRCSNGKMFGFQTIFVHVWSPNISRVDRVSTTRTISWCKEMKFLRKTSNFYDKRQNKIYHMCVDWERLPISIFILANSVSSGWNRRLVETACSTEVLRSGTLWTDHLACRKALILSARFYANMLKALGDQNTFLVEEGGILFLLKLFSTKWLNFHVCELTESCAVVTTCGLFLAFL